MSKRKKIGLSPGSLVYHGKIKTEPPQLIQVLYSHNSYKEEFLQNIQHKNEDSGLIRWLDIRGIHNVELIKHIGESSNIHRLILEDVLDPNQRSKIEAYDNGIFCIIKNIEYDRVNNKIHQEQISIFFSKKELISFQENPDDTFLVIRERMKAEISKTRSRNTDYLFYVLLDYIVDRYYLVLDLLDEDLELLEERVQIDDSEELFQEIYRLRSLILQVKKFIQPVRDEIIKIKKIEDHFIEDSTLIYLRDLEDHIVNVTESLDNQRELLNSIKDLSINQVSLNLNKDIKWLTVVSTISIPLLFMTGVYGMNFEYMPELKWRYGYLIWWIVTIGFISLLVLYFKKRKMF
ncbi:MAG: magnesium/cobalt transporter CorA [Bacteroidota bacterium]|nr:magnesium/cobalt transporter CorA [Bacteroidota bacterium]